MRTFEAWRDIPLASVTLGYQPAVVPDSHRGQKDNGRRKFCHFPKMAASADSTGVLRTAKLIQGLCNHLSPESDDGESMSPSNHQLLSHRGC